MAPGTRVGSAPAAEPGHDLMPIPEEILQSGKALQKVGTPFVTAIAVQKPRDLDKIVKAMDREAEYAGDAFWYSWTQKGEIIEGPTIGLANSLAREWGNCAVTCELQETDEAFYITARFIDLERGSQMERVFRQRKSQVQGRYDPERKLDMALQIGQSKAIRNVVVNAVPRWLVEKVIDNAKAAVAAKIDPKKLKELSEEVVKHFGQKGVKPEQLVAKAGRPMAEWTTRDIASFSADAKALKNGDVSLGDLFPAPEEPAAPSGPVTLDAAMGAKATEEQKFPSKQGALKCVKCVSPMSFSTDDQQAMVDHQFAIHGAKQETPSKQQAPPPATGQSGLFG